jgi:hypothetical protein
LSSSGRYKNYYFYTSGLGPNHGGGGHNSGAPGHNNGTNGDAPGTHFNGPTGSALGPHYYGPNGGVSGLKGILIFTTLALLYTPAAAPLRPLAHFKSTTRILKHYFYTSAQV